MGVAHRKRGYKLSNEGRKLFLRWINSVSPSGRSAVPVVRVEHAIASGLSRATLHNAIGNADKRFDESSRDQLVHVLGKSQDHLFDIPVEISGDAPPPMASSRSAANDLIAAIGLFDIRSSSPIALRSVSRQDRSDFLYWMERYRPIVDENLFLDLSQSTQFVVAHYYLSYADQLLVTDQNSAEALGQARWAIDRAVVCAARTNDNALLTTCLLHCSSILYSHKAFTAASEVHRQAVEVTAKVTDQQVGVLLRDRLAVNNASILAAERRFQEAAPWAREGAQACVHRQ